MFKIERDATKLNAMISRTIKGYHKSSEDLHVSFVSALAHAAQHGQPAPLNNLFNGLKEFPNLIVSMKNYVRRLDTLLDDEGNPVLDAAGKFQPSPYKFLEFTTKTGFATIKGTDSQRAAFIKHAEADLINPDGKIYKRVDQRDNVKEEQEFTTKNLLAAMKSLLEKAKGGKAMVNSMISPIEVKALEAAFDEITKIKEANAHKDALPARKPQPAPVAKEVPAAKAAPKATDKATANAPH